MSELEQLRQEAEQLRNQIRVSLSSDSAEIHWSLFYTIGVGVLITLSGFMLP